MSEHVNVLCVDLEDYYQCHYTGIPDSDWGRYPARLEAGTRRLLDILASHGVFATFFVLGYNAEREPGLVREVARAGHEIGAHGHRHRRLFDMTESEFREDVQHCLEALRTAGGFAAAGFRAPSWSLTARTPWATDILLAHGFKYDASAIPWSGFRHVRGMPGSSVFPYRMPSGIAEFPAPVWRVGGLTYPFSLATAFRITPYGLLSAMIRSYGRRYGMPAMVSIHPADFDPDQPRLPMSGLSKFMKYGKWGNVEQKLHGLLDEFPFGRMDAALKRLGLW